MWARIKDFDLYRKIPKDLTETSTHSTILSLCAAIFMLVLFVAELWSFLTINMQTNIIIDPTPDNSLRINFNITVLDMPCDYASIDVVDVLGTRRDNVTININKWQVDENGIRQGYHGRNLHQLDLVHQGNLDLAALHANGIHAVPIDHANFDHWLTTYEYVFVDFYAPWCVWCQRLHPVWEALAEEVEREQIPVSIVTVDCVENAELCLKNKIQAFPMMKLFKHGEFQSPDYRSDRTVEHMLGFLQQHLAQDEQIHLLTPEERQAHEERKLETRTDHPGCMLQGFVDVNRVPGNFHIQMRSRHHNINPTGANLSHVVNNLSFGPILSKTMLNKLAIVPKSHFSVDSTQPMNDLYYINEKLHQVYHHYIKVVATSVDVNHQYSGNNAVLAYQMVQSSQIMNYEETDVPEARFSYDLSPMSVVITQRNKKWYEFLTSMCALIGGTFTVVGLISTCLSNVFKPKKL